MVVTRPDTSGPDISRPAAHSSHDGHLAPILSIEGLSCGYGSKEILHDVSFELFSGHTIVLLGPNGVGKTTLFKTILGFLPRMGGKLRINGEDIGGWPRRRLASVVAYVPQAHIPAFGFTVREIVLMGRTPALDVWASPSKEDESIVDEVLEDLGLSELAERDYTTLSGGEGRMVLIARALAQQPALLIMDEPCANLDLGNQVLLLERILELNKRGLSLVVTSHDPNHAFQLDSSVVCFKRDGGVFSGPSRSILTAKNLSALYGVEVDIDKMVSSQGGTVYNCVPFVNGGQVEYDSE